MAVIDSGSSSAGKANVDANYNLNVVTPTNPTQAGSVRFFSENDPGAVTGTAYCYSPETSDDYRLRVGVDAMLDSEQFCYTTQNTGKHYFAFATMLNAIGSNFLTTNSGNITTINTATVFRTHKYFPFPAAQTSIYYGFSAALSAALTTNTTIDFGAFIHGTTPFAPTDGAYFRVTSAGFQGVINFNGVETTTSVFAFTHTINRVYKFIVSIDNAEVKFWIDDVLYGEIATQSGNGSPFASAALPMSIRHAIGGTAAGAALSLKVASYSVQYGDLMSNKPMADQQNGSGNMPYQGISGGTMGSSASYANSANPTSAAGSNTAANVTGLGGQGAINAAAGAATDYIATSFLNPASTTSYAGRTLYITGVRISAMNNGAAVATTPTTLAWSLAFGHTAVSLATAESAAWATATAKAPRRIALGFQTVPVGAAIGALYTPDSITMQFMSPIVVNQGEYIATVVKQLVGTATASQSIWYHVAFDGYYE